MMRRRREDYDADYNDEERKRITCQKESQEEKRPGLPQQEDPSIRVEAQKPD